MLRALVAVPLVALDTLVLFGPALLLALLDRSGRAAHGILRLWGRSILWLLGVQVLVAVADALPEPAVYAANHGSALDIPILFGYLPLSFRIVHKKALLPIPFLGWYLWLAGHIAIDRANPFRARRSLDAAARRIREGTSVVVFPEGTRSPDPRIQLFKRGSFVLALDAGVPVVPVSIKGVKHVVPRGLFTLRPGAVELRVHPPIPTAGGAAERAESLAEEVRRIVARGCEEECV